MTPKMTTLLLPQLAPLVQLQAVVELMVLNRYHLLAFVMTASSSPPSLGRALCHAERKPAQRCDHCLSQNG